jgi:predicted N-acyltransferase
MEFRHHARISEIPAARWDALTPNDQPFLRHAWLHALEAAACVGEGTGWQSAHAALWHEGELLAAMPLYLKQHSRGEYVFDWAWAEAYARHGLDYYPKWLAAIPFTPVPGQRLLGQSPQLRRALLEAILQAAQQSGLSSLHLLFAAPDEVRWAQELGCLRRSAVQFHWHNAGYRNFDDFLAALSSEKRKKIRQERRKVAEAGVQLRVIKGPQISLRDWSFFTRCYARTYALHRSEPYLNLDFFERLGDKLPQHCVLLIASQGERDIAASLLLRDRTALYGRYWGALEEVSCLHFEACYYAPIDYAISQGLARFEGGAQGEHKLARGLQAVETHSLHWLADARFADAVERFLEREAAGMALYINELEARSPLRPR